MKKILIISLFIFPFIADAQFFENHAIYSNQSFSFGNYTGPSLGINYIYKEKITFHAGGSMLFKNAIDLPAGERSCHAFLSGTPCEQLGSVEFMLGKIIRINNKTRFNLRAGVIYSEEKIPFNWGESSSWLWGRILTYEIKKDKRIGFVFEPAIEFPYLHWWGFSISSFLKADGKTLAYGIKINQLLGVLKNKR